MIKRMLNWILLPSPSARIDLRTYKLLMTDAAGIGIANSAAPFLTLFMVQMGASNIQVGLISAMPAFAGFLMALIVGRFIQQHKKITNLASVSVLLTYSSYFLTGLAAFFIKDGKTMVTAILVIWAAITIPQTLMGISYPTILRKAAGDNGRYELTTRRWAFIGLLTTIGTAVTGELLEGTKFPLNYQVAFMLLSLGGLLCFSSVRSIRFEGGQEIEQTKNILDDFHSYSQKIKAQKPFLSFIGKRFIFFIGATLTSPIVSLYYIREVNANARWIGYFSTMMMAALIIGYFFWLRTTHRVAPRNILLLTVGAISFYPFILSTTSNPYLILGLLAAVGFFQAGIDLVFFDELMKTIPIETCSVFISVHMLFQYLASAIGPMLGTTIANLATLKVALFVGGSLKMLAFILFVVGYARRKGASPGMEIST